MKNPYWGKTFFGFFETLAHRLALFIKQDLSLSDLVSDEIQLLVILFLSLSCALVGVFLVLKKMAMLANALSHTILLGIIVAFVIVQVDSIDQMSIFSLFLASLITAILTALFTQVLHQLFHLQKDAAIGLVFTFLFALGIILATLLTRNVHIGIEAVMGNADALQFSDVKQSLSVLFLNLILIIVFYRPLLVSTFDPYLAKSFGFFPSLFHYFFLVQVSWTAISSFRAVGVLLVLEFFICPFIIARYFCNRLVPLLFTACLFAFILSLFSIALSRHLLSSHGMAFSTSSIVALVMGGFVLLLIALGKKRVLSTP